MKKSLMGLLFISLTLVACSNEAEQQPVADQPVEETTTGSQEPEQTQEQLNEEIKKKAVRADFVEMNVDNPPDGKIVFVEGEVSVLTKGAIDEFILTSKEGNGHGMYNILLANTTDAEFSEGDHVKVYGAVNGKDDTGMPQIFANLLEKK